MHRTLISRVEQIEQVAHRTYQAHEGEGSEPWWMLFRDHLLWFDDGGRVIVSRDYEDDPGLQVLTTEINRGLAPGNIIVLLTESEAVSAVEALEAGQLTIRPQHYTDGDIAYYVGAPWVQPLAPILDTALEAVTRQRAAPALRTTESVIGFLRGCIEQYANDS